MTYYVKASYSRTRVPAIICNFKTEQEARQFLHDHKALHKRRWNGIVRYEIAKGTANLTETIRREEHYFRKELV